MKFNLRLHECCSTDSLRFVMQYVYFNNGKMVATDGHVLAVVDVMDIEMNDKEREIFMSFENRYLHRKAFQKIWNKEVVPTKDGFDCPSEFISVKFSDDDTLKFPKWENVIGDFKDKELSDTITVNPKLLFRLCNSIPGCKDTNQTVLYITNSSKAIMIFSKEVNKSYGLLMPVMSPNIKPVLDKETMLFSF
jgi:hypothetical protein